MVIQPKHEAVINKILSNYSNSVASDGNSEPDPFYNLASKFEISVHS
jgi:hypothetical protein